MSRFIIALFIVFLSLESSANDFVPFQDKKGKYGLIDSTTNTIILKPKYFQIKPTYNDELFVVSKLKGGVQKYGLLNSSTGKEVFPVKADTIIFTKKTKLAFIKKIDLESGKEEAHTTILNKNGNSVATFKGRLVKRYPDGYMFATTLDETNLEKFDGKKFLCNNKFEQIGKYSSAFMLGRFPVILTFPKNNYPEYLQHGYTIYNPNNFNKSLDIDQYRILASDVYLIKKNDHQYGILDSDNFEKIEWYPKLFDSGEKTYLYSHIDKECLLINKDKKIQLGKLIDTDSFDFPKIFVPVNDEGKYSFQGMNVDDVQMMESRKTFDSDYVCFKQNDLWGVYDIKKNELLLKPSLEKCPFERVGENMYAVKEESKTNIFNSNGNLKFSFDDKNLHSLEAKTKDHWLFFGYNPYDAVFNEKTGKWLVPFGKCKEILVSNNTIITLSKTGEFNIYNWDGSLKVRMTNIMRLGWVSYGTVCLVNKSGKMGVMNASTGKMITPFLYDNDIVWGSRGSGNTKRFAVQQTIGNNDIITVYTVGGQKIVTKSFPRGSSSHYALRKFNDQYLDY